MKCTFECGWYRGESWTVFFLSIGESAGKNGFTLFQVGIAKFRIGIGFYK